MGEAVIVPVRTAQDIADVSSLVWEFLGVLRERYPEMHAEIDTYIREQKVAESLRRFEAFFLPPHGEAFVAKLDGTAVGCVMLKPKNARTCELNRMFLRKEARGIGLGRKLCISIIDEARRLGYQTVELGALYKHVEAIPLYESLGFRRFHDTTASDASDDRVVHMNLQLS